MHSFLNITVRARLVLPNTRCKVKGLGKHPEVPFDLSFDSLPTLVFIVSMTDMNTLQRTS